MRPVRAVVVQISLKEGYKPTKKAVTISKLVGASKPLARSNHATSEQLIKQTSTESVSGNGQQSHAAVASLPPVRACRAFYKFFRIIAALCVVLGVRYCILSFSFRSSKSYFKRADICSLLSELLLGVLSVYLVLCYHARLWCL